MKVSVKEDVVIEISLTKLESVYLMSLIKAGFDDAETSRWGSGFREKVRITSREVYNALHDAGLRDET